MAKKASKKNNKNIIYIVGAILIALFILTAILKPAKDDSEPAPASQSTSMSIDEAQTKCMLMEEVDLIKYDGEVFGDETTKKAREKCLEKWDMSKNPNNTEEQFIKVITANWETRKSEILAGYTLEELYNESTK